jgi:hypothetical protein
MTAIRDRIPEKRRKDAVLCIEHLITASRSGTAGELKKKLHFLSSRKMARK